MKRVPFAIVVASLLAVSAPSGADPAVTVKQVSLRQAPAADAKAVATVEANTAVELVKRQGAWVQLQSGSDTGWAKLFDIKMGAPGAQPAKSSGGSGIADTLNLATGKRDASVTTGVRGLDAKMLQNAQPNEQQVAELATYAATPTKAQAFAKAGKLAVRNVAPMGDADAGATTK
jgi:hypothetical protein